MTKIVIDYRRTKTIIEQGRAEIELTEEAAKTLREGKNLEVWAIFTAIHQVENWKPATVQPAMKLEYVALIDGEKVGDNIGKAVNTTI